MATLAEIKQAIKTKQSVYFDFGDKHNWGELTCLADDESCVYYKPKGMGLTRGCTTPEHILMTWRE